MARFGGSGGEKKKKKRGGRGLSWGVGGVPSFICSTERFHRAQPEETLQSHPYTLSALRTWFAGLYQGWDGMIRAGARASPGRLDRDGLQRGV